jgi:hypothetical protein
MEAIDSWKSVGACNCNRELSSTVTEDEESQLPGDAKEFDHDTQ